MCCVSKSKADKQKFGLPFLIRFFEPAVCLSIDRLLRRTRVRSYRYGATTQSCLLYLTLKKLEVNSPGRNRVTNLRVKKPIPEGRTRLGLLSGKDNFLMLAYSCILFFYGSDNFTASCAFPPNIGQHHPLLASPFSPLPAQDSFGEN